MSSAFTPAGPRSLKLPTAPSALPKPTRAMVPPVWAMAASPSFGFEGSKRNLSAPEPPFR